MATADPRLSDGTEKRAYARILHSTSLVGAAAVLNVALGVVRTKVVALLLGPAGVGLTAAFTSIVEVVHSLAGMGIQNSGVRQIAEAAGSLDEATIARTATVLRRVAIGFGVLGAGVMVALSGPISQLTFGTREQAVGVALLSLVILFREIAMGQGALVQGMRRISDLARMNVLAAALGTVATIPILYIWGIRGVIPSLIATALVTVLTSSWYSRKVRVARLPVTVPELKRETAMLLKLGVAFMVAGFLTMGAGYVIRLIVLRRIGVEAAGNYQAAWALGGLYVSFILQAMGADFYPRLTGVSKDHAACNRMVNEQTHVSLLLAGPGVIATLTLAPLVIATFYSAAFGPAVPLLRWICLGMVMRVLAWPMGFVVLAKGEQAIMVLTELAAACVHVVLAWWLVPIVGLDGAGMAFLGLYVWHAAIIYLIVRRLTGFRWSAENRRLGLWLLPVTALIFVSASTMPAWQAVTTGLVATLLTTLYSARTLLMLLPGDSIPGIVRTWLARLTLTSRGTPNPALVE